MSLRVTAAQKSFRSRRGQVVPALRGVHLDVADDELLVVVGPSGSGKSTLLRVVSGLESLDAGRVTIGGGDVTQVPAGQRGVAMVFQDAALFPHLSVAGNIGIGERARGADRSRLRARVEEAAAVAGVEDLLERMPGELSGGERQRVALARAFIRSPRICLLDEPLSSIDPQLRWRMRQEIRALQRRLGVPMVHVTHDQQEAMALGDRIAVLHEGQVSQCGTPEELYAAPATVFVAGFVGTLPMNLVTHQAGRVIGVRPERVVLAPADVGDLGPNRWRGTVIAVEPLGEEAVVRIDTGVLDQPLLARVPWRERPVPGATVTAHWEPADEHRFDAASGRRISASGEPGVPG